MWRAEHETKKVENEKRGEHGSCEVAGWRYEGDSVWHVKVWPDNRDVRRNVYKVMSGMLEPDAATQAEREAVLHLIAKWESEQPSRPGPSPAHRFARPAQGYPYSLVRGSVFLVAFDPELPEPNDFDTHHIVVAHLEE